MCLLFTAKNVCLYFVEKNDEIDILCDTMCALSVEYLNFGHHPVRNANHSFNEVQFLYAPFSSLFVKYLLEIIIHKAYFCWGVVLFDI